MVVADGVKQDFLLFTVLARCQDVPLGFVLVAARPTAEHRNVALQDRRTDGQMDSQTNVTEPHWLQLLTW